MKRVSLILIGAIVLLIVVLLVESRNSPNIIGFRPFRLYPSIDTKNVAKIEITHLINGITLSKTDSTWQVSEFETEMAKEVNKSENSSVSSVTFRADAEKIGRVLEKLTGLEAKLLASSNPEKQALYEVDQLATRVKAFDSNGNLVIDLNIGKSGPDMFSTYVRRNGEQDVYLVGEQIGAMTSPDILAWRDKKIWNLDPAMIAKVSVEKTNQGKKEAFAIEKDGQGVWNLESPSAAILDTAKVEEFIGKIASPVSTRFASPLDGVFDKPEITLEIKDTNGKDETLEIGSADDQGYFKARVKGQEGDVYLLNKDFLAKIPTSWNALLPDQQ